MKYFAQGLSLLLSCAFFSLAAVTPEDSLKIQSLTLRSKSLLYANLDSAELLAEEALQLVKQLDYERGEIYAYAALANVRFYQQRLEECLELNERALNKATELNDLDEQMRALNNIGNYHYVKGDLKQAIKFYLASLELEKQLQGKGLATSYLNIGMVFEATQNYAKAEEFYGLALQYNDPPNPRVNLHTYTNLSVLFFHQNRYQEALENAQRVAGAAQELQSDEGLGRGYSLQTQSLLKLSQPTKALQAADSALNYLLPENPEYRIVEIQKAQALTELERYGQSRDILERLQNASDTSHTQGLQQYSEVLFGLYQLERAKGDFAESLAFFEQYKTLQDTLAARQKAQELDRLLTEFETREKTQEITRLKQQAKITELELRQSRYLLFGIGALVLLVVVSGWLFLQQRKLRHKQLLLEISLRWRRAQLNPHFFFNALMAVRSLLTQGEVKKSGKALQQFARLMRHVLESSNHERISLEEEVRFLEDYLKLQQLRFPFTYQIDLTEEEDPEFIQVPAMLLQPFVENAIEHGLAKSERKDKHLYVSFTLLDEHTLEAKVRDNGIGREQSESNKPATHRSRATEITLDRQQLMQEMFRFEILDLKDQQNQAVGTEVRFAILMA